MIEKAVSKFIANPYAMRMGSGKLSKRWGFPKEIIAEARIKAKSLLKLDKNAIVANHIADLEDELVQHFDKDKGTLESTAVSIFNPRTDEELATLHKVDLIKYKISSYWSKLKSNGKFTSSVFCTLRKVASDPVLQKQAFIELIESYTIDYSDLSTPPATSSANSLYLISIPDLHLGKLAHSKETGEDYDLREAICRYDAAVDYLLSKVNLNQIDRFLFPVGNDMINIDGESGLTTAGTPQDVDSRFNKLLYTARDLLIKTIDKLQQIAPVDVIIVAGNHDQQSMFTIGMVLEAWYRTAHNVRIQNSSKPRKYYQYYNSGFQFTHGDEEKQNDLGLIFATEQKVLWGNTDYHYCQLGHFHKGKKIQYVEVDEFQGFQIQILPSLSGTDYWHSRKGYSSLKRAKGFLYSQTSGCDGEFTYTFK